MNTAGMVQSGLRSHGSSCDVVLPLGICEKQGMERLAAVLCLGRRGIWLSAAQPGSLPAAIKPAVQQQQGCELQGSCPLPRMLLHYLWVDEAHAAARRQPGQH